MEFQFVGVGVGGGGHLLLGSTIDKEKPVSVEPSELSMVFLK